MQHNSLNAYYQQAFYDVIRNAVDEFPRTLALRVDLRFPRHYQYGDSNKSFRFIESLQLLLMRYNVRTYDGNVTDLIDYGMHGYVK